MGEWDGVIPDEDASWLFNAFNAAPVKRDVKIGRGTHLMHLEIMRNELYRESISFLSGADQVPARRRLMGQRTGAEGGSHVRCDL